MNKKTILVGAITCMLLSILMRWVPVESDYAKFWMCMDGSAGLVLLWIGLSLP